MIYHIRTKYFFPKTLFNVTVFASNSSLPRIPYLISNAVLSTGQLKQRWKELMEDLVEKWLSYGELNIITGPVFDNDADSYMDNIFDVG